MKQISAVDYRWRVLFDDGNNGAISKNDLVVTKSIPKGFPILAQKKNAEDEFHPAIVKCVVGENIYEVTYLEDECPAISRYNQGY